MPLGTLQSFLQSYQQGRNWQQQQSDAEALRRAQTAVGNTDFSSPPPQPAAPQPAQQPSSLPLPVMQALAALHGAGQGGAPGPQGAPQMPPQGAGASPAMQTPQRPPAPPVDPSLSATAQPQAAGEMNAWQESIQNIKALRASILASNPKIDPITLGRAVSMEIDNIKGIAPTTRATMQAQMQVLQTQQRGQAALMRYNAAIQAIEQKYSHDKSEAASRAQVADILAASRNYDAEVRGEAETTSAGIRGQAEEASAGTRADAARDVADMNLEGRMYAADQGERAAEARGNVKGLPHTAAPQRPQFHGAGQRAGGGGGGPVRVNGPDDVKKLPKGTPWVSSDGAYHGTT